MEQQRQETNEVRQKLTLKVDNPFKFDGLVSTCPMKSTKLATLVHELFDSFFSDVFGAKIEISPETGYRPVLLIAFKEQLNDTSGDGKFKGIERAINKTNDQLSVIKRMQNRGFGNNGRIYQLTEELKDILHDIVPTYAYNTSNRGIAWNKIVNEGPIQNMMNDFGQNYIIVSVELDLNRLCKYLFGEKSENGGKYHYMVNVGNPISPTYRTNTTPISTEWSLFILRMDEATFNSVAAELGLGIVNNLGYV